MDKDFMPMSAEQAAANWGQAYGARENAETQLQHNQAGARDHRAFSRHMVNEHPIAGAPTMLASIPAYNVAKRIGLVRGRSEPSLHSAAEAYRGVAEGMGDVLHRLSNRSF